MDKKLIVIIATVICSGLIVFLLIFPAFEKIRTLGAELKLEKESLDREKEAVEQLSVLEKEYLAVLEERKKIGDILPQDRDIPGLLVQLEAISSENGLVLEAVNFVEEKPKIFLGEGEVLVTEYKTLDVSLDLLGSYKAFKSFIKAVEENIRLMDIVSSDFAGEGEGGTVASNILSFNVKLKTYYQ